MGQYYMAIDLDRKEYLDPAGFGYGRKLTETCIVGNAYVAALSHLLENEWRGDSVIVCGEYAWDEGGSASAKLHDLAAEDPCTACEDSEGEARPPYRNRTGDFASARSEEGTREIRPAVRRFIVNATKKVYYDRLKCCIAWAGRDERGPHVARIDPLTILLACGNGCGAGDYFGPNRVLAGSWIGDAVAPSDVRPEGFDEIACPIDEEEAFLVVSDEEILPFIPEGNCFVDPKSLAAKMARSDKSL